MKVQPQRDQVKLIGVAIICAALVVFGHLILSKSLAEQLWVEYTAALIPFALFAIGVVSFRYAAAKDEANEHGDAH
ncbi:hypothetical protein VV869_17290 [Photobacterium sp. MCCC 1A19761]|uniref:hypothetical protein n=1 Tax=unclassified Photobacterium TaxID=2628852 RepID=UPI0021BF3D26|nr:hypothetical protein [Photobacterium sp. TY1-4]UXI00914.1 hypothetical protein NH461_14110 [Photobacterium sp. TY1-4]